MNTYTDPRPDYTVFAWQDRRHKTHFPRAYMAAGFLFLKESRWLPWHTWRMVDVDTINGGRR